MERNIVIKEFFGPDEHLYEDQLGWRKYHIMEARSQVSKEIFNHMIVTVGFNMTFYYVDNDTYYGIHSEEWPTPVKILPRRMECPYIDGQCFEDSHADGEVIASFRSRKVIWDKLKIDGKNLEEVLQRSYIMNLD